MKFSKKINPLLLIGSLLICCVCVAGYFSLARPGIGTRWKQEPAPPESIMRLELGDAGEILGVTDGETMYEFMYGSYQTASSWEEVSQPSGNPVIGEDCKEGDTNRIVLPPPGDVASQVSVNCVYIESGYRLEVVLLDNGEVWSWEHEVYAYAVLFNAAILFIGMAVGILLLLAGVGWVVIKKFRKYLNSKNKIDQPISTGIQN